MKDNKEINAQLQGERGSNQLGTGHQSGAVQERRGSEFGIDDQPEVVHLVTQ